MTRVSYEARASWGLVAESHRDYMLRLNDLLKSHRPEIVGLVELSFRTPMDAGIAFALLPCLTEQERQELLPLMLSLCHPNDYPHIARPFILDLPRAWVIANIERAADGVLAGNDHLAWSALLTLFDELSGRLGRRFAERMAQNPDPEIRDVGLEYLADKGT